MDIIGRHEELKTLAKLYESKTSEFVMVYGRRRVGKTYLIREYFNDRLAFHLTGIANGSKKEQLLNFKTTLQKHNLSAEQATPSCWLEAFQMLIEFLEKNKTKRKVVFLDELPWLDTPKSDFIKALEHFWNSWASARTDILLIVCGSAASWLVKNIVKNHGGLHNRITYKIKLNPFSLKETKEYLYSQNIKWDNQMIAECYMILGGIPYYLKMLDKRFSLAQNIDNMFFSDSPLLENEFENLYSSLFKNYEEYIKIIETLAKKKSGYTRDEILSSTKITDGGSFSKRLEELEQCCFIRKYKSKGHASVIYQLIDFFSIFYFGFIAKGKNYDSNNWLHFTGTPKYNTWRGLSFERLCITHLQQIKKALGISGVSTQSYTYYSSDSQIDLVIERGDKLVNLCEIKFVDDKFNITKAYSEKLISKIKDIKHAFKNKRGVYMTMITTQGVVKNEYSINLIQNEIVLDDLFL